MDPIVSEIMETDVVSIGSTRSLRAAGTRLYEKDIGSVIVHSEDDVPVGILTPTDLLEAIAKDSESLSDITAADYMSRPLLSIEPDKPVRSAVRQMNEEGVEQLMIIDEFDVVGIVSRNDVITAYESLIKAAHEAEQRPGSS